MKLRSHLSPVDPDIALIIGALCVVRRERYTAHCHIHGFYIHLYVHKITAARDNSLAFVNNVRFKQQKLSCLYFYYGQNIFHWKMSR